MQIVTFLYNTAVSFWIGGAALFTFLLTPIIFKTFNRDMAGNIVGVLFPSYFRWGLICGIIALVCLFFKKGKFALVSSVLLVLMIGLSAIQAFVIEPKSAELKRSITSFETVPPENPKRMQFKKLHGISMASNIAVIAGGIALILFSSLEGYKGQHIVKDIPSKPTTVQASRQTK